MTTLPRIEFEDADPALKETLSPTVERLGYYGEFFQVVGHLPDAVQTFMAYTAAVKSPLDLNMNEVLALTVCARCGGDYERIQHERLAAKSGLSREWIAELTGAATPGESLLSDTERKLRDLAIAVVDGTNTAPFLEDVVADLGAERAVAAMLQITRFQMISTLCRVLDLSLPVKSIFDE